MTTSRPAPPARTGSRSPRARGTADSYGLVVAAGKGRRFGGPKQFALVRGQPLLMHSLAPFERCRDIRGYVVVTSLRRIASVRRMLDAARLRKVIAVVSGGPRRSDSVRNGLALLPPVGCVAVHDAARPLLTAKMLTAGLCACRRFGPVTFGRPVADTLKQVRGRQILGTVDRSCLIAVETPQFFPIDVLRRAHERALSDGTRATDDCALVERLGIRPHWLLTPGTNIKVTTRADLAVCAALL